MLNLIVKSYCGLICPEIRCVLIYCANLTVFIVTTYDSLQKYQQDLQREDFVHDAAQENAVRHLQRLYDDYNGRQTGAKGWLPNYSLKIARRV